MIWRLAGILIAILAVYAGGQLVWHAFTRNAHPTGAAAVSGGEVAVSTSNVLPPAPVVPAQAPITAPALTAAPPPPVPTGPCQAAPAFAAAAAQNAASLTSASWSVFGRAETGWEIYAPLTAHEIATACGPDQPGFAEALSVWQKQHGLPSSGVMDPVTLKALNILWLRRRPFVEASGHGVCPPPPPAFRLAYATPSEGYLTKPIQMRTTALGAYRQMIAAARQDLPSMAADKRLLTIFSGYRDPVDDAARCAKDGNCGTITKANCSAHRTGLAMDVFLGAAPGFVPESSADPNRLYQSRGEVYRWMVANAPRFGFVPYPFEPWHWEWTGEAP
jgi:LAS superfamily LD-carboxypeptidase LdcB